MPDCEAEQNFLVSWSKYLWRVITVNTKPVRADTFSIRVFFSQTHIQHLTTNTRISRDLFYSLNASFWLLVLPILKICIPTENFDTYEHNQLPSALTYIFLRTQLTDSQLKFSCTLCLFALLGVERFAWISGKKLWKDSVRGLSVLEELLLEPALITGFTSKQSEIRL